MAFKMIASRCVADVYCAWHSMAARGATPPDKFMFFDSNRKSARIKVFLRICVVDVILFDFHFAIKLSFKLFFNLDCCDFVSFSLTADSYTFWISIVFSLYVCLFISCIHLVFFLLMIYNQHLHVGTPFEHMAKTVCLCLCMKFIVLLAFAVYFSAEPQNGDACIWCY